MLEGAPDLRGIKHLCRSFEFLNSPINCPELAPIAADPITVTCRVSGCSIISPWPVAVPLGNLSGPLLFRGHPSETSKPAWRRSLII
jgi:hypothetical protein